jgi:hypothetical protein
VEIKLSDEALDSGAVCRSRCNYYQRLNFLEKSPGHFLSAIHFLREIHCAGYFRGDALLRESSTALRMGFHHGVNSFSFIVMYKFSFLGHRYKSIIRIQEYSSGSRVVVVR